MSVHKTAGSMTWTDRSLEIFHSDNGSIDLAIFRRPWEQGDPYETLPEVLLTMKPREARQLADMLNHAAETSEKGMLRGHHGSN